MSGARRAPMTAAGSILRSSRDVAAFSRMAERLPRPRTRTGTHAVYMESDMALGLSIIEEWIGPAPCGAKLDRTYAGCRRQARTRLQIGAAPRTSPCRPTHLL